MSEKQLIAIVDSAINEQNGPRLFNEQLFLGTPEEIEGVPGAMD